MEAHRSGIYTLLSEALLGFRPPFPESPPCITLRPRAAEGVQGETSPVCECVSLQVHRGLCES